MPSATSSFPRRTNIPQAGSSGTLQETRVEIWRHAFVGSDELIREHILSDSEQDRAAHEVECVSDYGTGWDVSVRENSLSQTNWLLNCDSKLASGGGVD